MTKDEGWEGICGYNAAMLRPQWPVERLKRESERLWDRHVEKYGPPLIRLDSGAPGPQEMPAFTLGALLDDQSPMPEDIIAPRVLTPGGLLVLGGAPKVGKSDLLISWLVHMAAGVPFLGFTPPRPLRIFYLQAEIQYHYLRERLKQIALPPEVLAAARDTFVATPKLKMLLDNEGSVRVARAVQTAFPDAPPDILCVDPIRNLFDGGPDGGGENDNTAMMFFLKERVEVLRDHIDPDCGVILIHHTKKLSKQQVKDDPFLALSGASALRGFYTSGLILHRPDEDSSQRKLEIELRNGPALAAKLIDKVERPMGRDQPDERAAGARGGRGEARCRADRKQRCHPRHPARRGGRGAALHDRPSSLRPSRISAGSAGRTPSAAGSGCWPPRATSSSFATARPIGLGASRSRFGYPLRRGHGRAAGTARKWTRTPERCWPISVRSLPSHYKSPADRRAPRGREPLRLGLSGGRAVMILSEERFPQNCAQASLNQIVGHCRIRSPSARTSARFQLQPVSAVSKLPLQDSRKPHSIRRNQFGQRGVFRPPETENHKTCQMVGSRHPNWVGVHPPYGSGEKPSGFSHPPPGVSRTASQA